MDHTSFVSLNNFKNEGEIEWKNEAIIFGPEVLEDESFDVDNSDIQPEKGTFSPINIMDYIGKGCPKTLYYYYFPPYFNGLHNRRLLQQCLLKSSINRNGQRLRIGSTQYNPEMGPVKFSIVCARYKMASHKQQKKNVRSTDKVFNKKNEMTKNSQQHGGDIDIIPGQENQLVQQESLPTKDTLMRKTSSANTRGPKRRNTHTKLPVTKDKLCRFNFTVFYEEQTTKWYLKGGLGCPFHRGHAEDFGNKSSKVLSPTEERPVQMLSDQEKKEEIGDVQEIVNVGDKDADKHTDKDIGLVEVTMTLLDNNANMLEEKKNIGNAYTDMHPIFKSLMDMCSSVPEVYMFVNKVLLETMEKSLSIIRNQNNNHCSASDQEQSKDVSDNNGLISSKMEMDCSRKCKRLTPIGERDMDTRKKMRRCDASKGVDSVI